MRKVSTLALLAAWLLTACTSYVHFDAIKPAAVNIPPDFKKVLLVNRSGIPRNGFNKFEQVVTGEWKGEDRKAGFRCLEGIGDMLTRSLKGYSTMVLKDTILAGGPGNMVMAEPLGKRTLDSLCKKYGADFVITLEAFDTDILNKATGAPVMLSPLPLINPLAGPTFTLMSRVKAGFRIYDPKNGNLVDRFDMSQNYDFAYMHISDQEVMLHLPHVIEGICQNGYNVGSDYGYRVSPQMTQRTRMIYRKGNSMMKIADRSMAVGKWDDAFATWQQVSTSGKTKAAWHAMYNMAVYYEKIGNLSKAVETAEKGYQQFGRRPLLDYSYVLRDMQYEEKKVVEQLPDEKK
jgi:hypothetical protein